MFILGETSQMEDNLSYTCPDKSKMYLDVL